MKIFITGGNGFLGSALKKHLIDTGNEVISPTSEECNLVLEDSLEKFEDEDFDQIFHLAAWTQAGDFCLLHPGEQWIINQKINTNVLSWWQKNQPQAKLIFMGTSCAYSPECDLVEENYMSGEPIDSLYTYAMTKRMMYQGARAMQKQFGLDWLCAVPSTLYGPGYHSDGRQMHFIFDLIRKILRGKHFGEPVVLWGDGHQRRELVYLDDFIKTLINVNTNNKNILINIGAGKDYSIREFASIICNLVSYDQERIQYDTTKYVGAKTKKLSVEKLISIYPDYIERQTKLNEGIKSVIEWFKKTSAY
jgi:GDP-L-fucose synthase